METSLLSFVAAHRSAPLDALMLALSVLGKVGAVWVLIAGLRAVINRRAAMAAWQTVLAVLLAWVIVDGAVKPLVQRPRPFITGGEIAVAGAGAESSSFPSGHAATAAAGAAMLASSWPAARAGLWALAVAISCSRLYLGVHYPSDVLGGFLLGCAVAWFVRGRTVWRQGPARSNP